MSLWGNNLSNFYFVDQYSGRAIPVAAGQATGEMGAPMGTYTPQGAVVGGQAPPAGTMGGQGMAMPQGASSSGGGGMSGMANVLGNMFSGLGQAGANYFSYTPGPTKPISPVIAQYPSGGLSGFQPSQRQPVFG